MGRGAVPSSADDEEEHTAIELVGVVAQVDAGDNDDGAPSADVWSDTIVASMPVTSTEGAQEEMWVEAASMLTVPNELELNGAINVDLLSAQTSDNVH